MSKAILLLLAALLPAGAAAAIACRFASGGGLAFGTYDLLAAAPTDSQATLTVTCERNGGTPGIVITVRVDQGANGASVSARRMVHTGGFRDALHYGLYRDAARSSVWGVSDSIDTVSASLSVPDRGSASAQFTTYGRVPPRQDARTGSYADRVQVTILY